MPTYEYIAMDHRGKLQRGSIAAESAGSARRMLRGRKLHARSLKSVRETSHAGQSVRGRLFSSRRRRTVLELTRQLATMIQADVKLTESLDVLIAQAGDSKFSQVLQNIRDEVIAGGSLADGLREYPEWFDRVYVSMVQIGQTTGNLGRSFQLLADYMGKRQRLESKIKSALMYPIILVVMCILVTTFLMTVVIPKVSMVILSSGRELPWVTTLVMGISQFIQDFWWLLLLLAFGVYWAVGRVLGTEKGRLFFDRFLLRLPVIGELLRQQIVARFSTTLAALIRSGLPMDDSLQVVAGVTGNAVMATAVRQARERIVAGADVATPLRESKVVGPAVAHMISIGEKTGELETMLLKIAESMEENTDTTVQRISSVIEPLIIVVMAGVIGVVVIAILLPIMQAADISKM